jgi:hypothetical protein
MTDYRNYTTSHLGYLLEDLVRVSSEDIGVEAQELLLACAIGLYNHDIVQRESVEMAKSLIFVADLNKVLLDKLGIEK